MGGGGGGGGGRASPPSPPVDKTLIGNIQSYRIAGSILESSSFSLDLQPTFRDQSLFSSSLALQNLALLDSQLLPQGIATVVQLQIYPQQS